METKSAGYQELLIFLADNVRWPVRGKDLVDLFLIKHSATAEEDRLILEQRIRAGKIYYSRQEVLKDLGIAFGKDTYETTLGQSETRAISSVTDETQGDYPGLNVLQARVTMRSRQKTKI